MNYYDDEPTPEFEVKSREPNGTGVIVIITCAACGRFDKYRQFSYVTSGVEKNVIKAKTDLLIAFKYDRGIYNSETKRF